MHLIIPVTFSNTFIAMPLCVPPQVVMWINQSFLLVDDVKADDDSSSGLRIKFQCLRNKGALVLQVTADCKFSLHCDNMDLAADVVQSLANYLNLEDLEVCC